MLFVSIQTHYIFFFNCRKLCFNLPFQSSFVSFSTSKNFVSKKSVSKIDIHSAKYTRLNRSSKLANFSSFFKSFTYFKPLVGTNSDCFFNQEQSSNFLLPKTQFLLLFLNQGLSSKELVLLRSNFKKLGISFTHIPTRFWSNSFIAPSNPSSHFSSLNTSLFKKAIHGNILGLHLNFQHPFFTKASISSFDTHPLFLSYQFLQNFLLHQSSFSVSNPLITPLYSSVLNSHSDFLNSHNLNLSRLTLPWDFLASQTIPDSIHDVDLLNLWFHDNSFNHFNLLFHHLKNFRLIFSGLLGSNSSHSSYLFFDNLNYSLSPVNSSSSSRSLIFLNQACFNFEPFIFVCFNRKFLLFL